MNTTTTRKSSKPDTTTVTTRRVGQPKEAAVPATSRTRKTTTKATAQPKAAPTKAPAKKAAPKAEVKKSDLQPWERDWTYMADKAPTDLHEDMAAFILEATGVDLEDLSPEEIWVKAVQATAVMRHVYQASPRNKQRGDYRGLDETVVSKRSEHMIQAHTEARELREAAQQKAEAAKKAAAAKRSAARKARTAK